MAFTLNKYIIFFVLFSPFFLLGQTGIIKGRVADTNGNVILGANVILAGSYLGATTDIDGGYEILKVSPGRHVLKCSCVGYPFVTDTVEISNTGDVVVKNFFLFDMKFPLIMPDSLMWYHKALSSYKPEEVLNIVIDSASTGMVTIYVTFTNKTIFPLYLLQNPETSLVPLGEAKESGIKRKCLSECGVVAYDPFRLSNIIKIEPFGKVSTQTSSYSYVEYSRDDKKYLKLRYNVEVNKYPKVYYHELEPACYIEQHEEIYVLNRITRGTFFSDNEIVIDNYSRNESR